MASVLENVATFVSFPDPSDSSCTDVQGGLSLVTTSGKARRLWQQPLTRSHFQVISGTVRLPFAPLMPEDRSWLWFRPARA